MYTVASSFPIHAFGIISFPYSSVPHLPYYSFRLAKTTPTTLLAIVFSLTKHCCRPMWSSYHVIMFPFCSHQLHLLLLDTALIVSINQLFSSLTAGCSEPFVSLLLAHAINLTRQSSRLPDLPLKVGCLELQYLHSRWHIQLDLNINLHAKPNPDSGCDLHDNVPLSSAIVAF